MLGMYLLPLNGIVTMPGALGMIVIPKILMVTTILITRGMAGGKTYVQSKMAAATILLLLFTF